MPVKLFRIHASFTQPIPDKWREQLVVLMGVRPRRLSSWCELGLFGAFSCLKNHLTSTGVSNLSSEVPIRVTTHLGTINATQKAIGQMTEGLPTPFAFMQTLPGQLFNALGTSLAWQGDGITTAASHPGKGELALLCTLNSTTLLALVDELPFPVSCWVLLEPCEQEQAPSWRPLGSLFAIDAGTRWLKLDGQRLLQSD